MNKELSKRILTSIIISILSLFCILKGSYFFNIFIFLTFCLSLFEWYNLCIKRNIFIVGTLFLLISFISAYNIRYIDLSFFLFVILICVSSDIGGFIFGKIFKGPKLSKISPNKTYAGSIGSFILSIVFSLLYVFYFDSSLNQNLNINFNQFVLIVITLSAINQFGDLIISYFKRLKKIKNTGKILPGHGGLLDRIDGIIFTLPSSYFFNLVIL